jgi:Na+-transporting NADH:ubiquinone oxidoreductase subunit NqrD
MVMAPGAFFAAGFLIWVLNSFKKVEEDEEDK